MGGQRRRCADSRQGPAQPPARRTCSRRRATSATRDARTHQHRYHPAVRRSGRRVTGGRSRFAVASSVDPTTSVGVRRGRVRPLSSCLLGRASRPPQCVLGLPFELLAGAANLGPGPSRVGPCVLPDRSPRTRSDGDQGSRIHFRERVHTSTRPLLSRERKPPVSVDGLGPRARCGSWQPRRVWRLQRRGDRRGGHRLRVCWQARWRVGWRVRDRRPC